ncbi:MAG: ABC transporter permease [Bacteroidaceae bacterium]|nr:ABC transporter permease [Bacteroidaceae bacterium]
MVLRALQRVGDWLLVMRRALARPQNGRLFRRQVADNMWRLGVGSLPLVLIVSLAIGVLLVLQIVLNFGYPWLPRFAIGYAAREVILLEFSTAIVCVILAGKVGSNIASEIGTMRITQQIDALDVMGVNSAGYVILPKVVAFVGFIPVINIISVSAAMLGAFLLCWVGGVMPADSLQVGLQHSFQSWYVWGGIIKSVVFAFIISSVSAYEGYSVRGGSVEVGNASTHAVVYSSILILFADILLTSLLK